MVERARERVCVCVCECVCVLACVGYIDGHVSLQDDEQLVHGVLGTHQHVPGGKGLHGHGQREVVQEGLPRGLTNTKNIRINTQKHTHTHTQKRTHTRTHAV